MFLNHHIAKINIQEQLEQFFYKCYQQFFWVVNYFLLILKDKKKSYIYLVDIRKIMKNETLIAYLKLLACEGIGVLNARRLIEHFQSITAIFDEDQKFDSFENPVLEKRFKAAIKELDMGLVEEELQFILDEKLKVVGILDADYPKLLKECPDAPIVLFYKGDLTLLTQKSIAIVGTRKITTYGKKVMQDFIEKIAIYQPTLISGMAYGVDVNVYHLAKKNDLPSVAVMGTSFKKYYPKSHSKYYHELEENGLILSEYAGFNKLVPELFLRRNRIIAGLTKATVIIESAEKGGSLSTAFFANDYNREVYAIPGRTTDEFSKGCLRLIQQNRAQLLFDLEPMFFELGWSSSNKVLMNDAPKAVLNLESFSPTEQAILKCLEKGSQHIDDLAFETALDMSVLNAELMMLELNAVIEALPGKTFQLK